MMQRPPSASRRSCSASPIVRANDDGFAPSDAANQAATYGFAGSRYGICGHAASVSVARYTKLRTYDTRSAQRSPQNRVDPGTCPSNSRRRRPPVSAL